jgi:arylsulfatase
MIHAPFQLVDVMPTIIEAAGAQYPPKSRGSVRALEGRSMLPTLRNEELAVVPLYWEHTGNAAIRVGNWKLVREYPGGWELYDMVTDRAEMHDLASERLDIVAELGALWEKWAERVGVIPFEVTLQLYRDRGLTDTEAAG